MIYSPKNTKKLCQGISLLELSIVLVIVGLSVGALLTGQTLLRAAEMRTMQKELGLYEEALGTFIKKYGAVPGDMANATEIWGAADGGDGLGADCTAINTKGSRLTCNGNGNGNIQQQALDAQRYETWRAWQHMENAGLVTGPFTGVTHLATSRQAVPGENVPESNIGNVGYTIFYKPDGAWGDWFAKDYDVHVFSVGMEGGEETRDPFLSVSDMVSLDQKYDDGRPGSGFIETLAASRLPNCVTTNDPMTATYVMTDPDSANACSFFYMTPY